ncbi:MAG: 5-(carboxyamino)imidazole ribonucleotide mutase [Bacteroidales bacterium]|nr:5-(carboxyamino)imidazole ribonucleotide mutase [Lentimicrobiaceae bacterium]MDD5693776.1 5-(carboxyamino)imidazole ribonucleotide mutase [Bacteroidales bacterium]
MKPLVSIIMGSTSDLPVMEEAAKILDELEIPFEMNALSAHRTPELVDTFARNACDRGIQVIIAGAGMAAHLPGVIAALTPLPVIGVPIKASLEGLDAVLSILQMPPGIPVATVGINGARNAGILAAQILAICDPDLRTKIILFKNDLKRKIEQANKELQRVDYRFKCNHGVNNLNTRG